jgi:S-layer homology domain
MYNEFTGGTPVLGATELTWGAAFDNTGALNPALFTKTRNGGNFLGVQDAWMTLKDAAGNIEQYDILTGLGVRETASGTFAPISLVSPNPHQGEDLISSGGVKNPAIIDTYDLGVMLLDADGTTSTYYTTTSSLFADHTYTALSGGWNMNGATMTTLKTNPNFVGIENLYFLTLNADGTGLELYSTVSGVYAGPWSLTTPLLGGPLNGKTVADAVHNTHGVAGITFVGIGETDLAFYDSVNSMMVYYNHANFINTWAGFAITSPTNGSLTLGAFAGPIADAMSSGRFLGVANATLLFIDDVWQLQAYNAVNGIGVGVYPAQPLEGPQAGQLPYNANFIDTADSGYAYIDSNATTSVYYGLNGTLQILYNDQRWKKLNGGSHSGEAPTLTNIIDAEDLLYYTVGSDNSLEAYTYLDGNVWPTDLWTWTKFTGGVLDGQNLTDAINGTISDVKFLGIANDQLVFLIPTSNTITVGFTSPTTTQVEANAGAVYFASGNTVTVDGVVSSTITITLAASGGTATVAEDYTYSGETITILPGIYNNIPVPFYGPIIKGDTTHESDDTILLSLATTATGVTLASTLRTHTIINDDPVPVGAGGGGGGGAVTPVTTAVINTTNSTSTPSTISVPVKNTVITVTPAPIPSVSPASGNPILFQNFVAKCGSEIENLNDNRLKNYYNNLESSISRGFNDKATRAEFVELVLLSIGADVSGEKSVTYTDVTMSHPQAQYIAYATRLGIITGKDGLFRPDDQISRAEAAKILILGTGVQISDTISTFSDVSERSTLGKYIQTAYDSCILHGRRTLDGETTLASQRRIFEPYDGITVAETAKVLYNITQR